MRRSLDNNLTKYENLKTGDKLYTIYHDKLITVTLTKTPNLGLEGVYSLDGNHLEPVHIYRANMGNQYFYDVKSAIDFNVDKHEQEIIKLYQEITELEEKIHECENHILRLRIIEAQREE